MGICLTILVCTHNRVDLLERALSSLNGAKRPVIPVKILVAANACTDDTVARMKAYQASQVRNNWLPLSLLEVPTPGKSHALNSAIPQIDSDLTAFVDDDHRVDKNYLLAIEKAAQAWPDAGLYCGRIRPDWDGTEPPWVHDEGPYRIYPLPVPRYDQDDAPKTITMEAGPIPGGGNLVVRRQVFEQVGLFSTDLGPHGHDLGGGEDSEYVLRAMARGVRCQYTPDMVQYHYVDLERLRLTYLLKKAYQRTRSTSRIRGNGRVPLYMWRKVAEYSFHSLFSLSWAKSRFYMVRTAAALGEVQGRHESGHHGRGLKLANDRVGLGVGLLAILTVLSGLAAWFTSGGWYLDGVVPALAVAGIATMTLLIKSLSNFSQTGPRIREEILTKFRRYTLFAIIRLCLWSLAIMLFVAGGGVLVYYALNVIVGGTWSAWLASFAATLSVLGTSGLQFIRKLRFNPGLLVASMHYRMSRLYPLWQWFTPARINLLLSAVGLSLAVLGVSALLQLAEQNQYAEMISLVAAVLFYVGLIAWCGWQPESRAARPAARPKGSAPNVLMIGSDTMRADRLSSLGYHRALTPNIDTLAAQGVLFGNCYVPCARTAPSLVSMLTGTWPHTHGIRDNFIADEHTRLNVDTLPQLLKRQGYSTAALSDWCGGDMGKFSFGFDHTELPEDQWNLKYLIRQGPKDLRLFISLFTHNRLGRVFLPELYYLGGVPLTSQMGRRARRLVSQMAKSAQPFFINVFYSTTHPPFASEWPWYMRFADPAYAGESKFAMARLTDPFEIIRRQGAPKEEFDLDQIINLYDGCVAEFDDEVGKTLRHLEACGLAESTIIVVYSDHGMEFFEHDSWGQGNSAVGEASPRIPLIIRDPRLSGRGKVDDVVRTIDLAPTLLELCGYSSTGKMDGVSLVDCMKLDSTCPNLDAYNETGIWIADIPGLPDEHLRYPNLLELIEVPNLDSGTLAVKREYCEAIFAAKDRMIRSGRWKLVYQPLASGYLLRLFDLHTDPTCQRDVASIHPDVQRALWKKLQCFINAPMAHSANA